jgi:IS5 family transposase
MRREVRKLRTWLGRVIRDVQRKAGEITGALKTRIETAQRLYEQRRDSKNKLYALHAPVVECIAKGKARTPYEFGVKTSVAVTAKKGVVVGMRSMPGAPYDGHTLHSQLEQVEILTGVKPGLALGDRGYRGAPPPEGPRLLISHTRGLPPALKKLLKRRQAIEPTIGHMKTDGLLARNWLKGSEGDAIHAVLCGAGHNLRLILAHLRGASLGLDRADALCPEVRQSGVARDGGNAGRRCALTCSGPFELNALFRADSPSSAPFGRLRCAPGSGPSPSHSENVR